MSVARVGDDAERLAVLERQIEAGRLAVGAALAEVRDERLYLVSHASFEAYCNDRWAFGPRRANQLIAAAAVLGTIVPGEPAPTNEAQARALAAAAPAERADVMAAVAGKGKPTAAAIADEIKARQPSPASGVPEETPLTPGTPPNPEPDRDVCVDCGAIDPPGFAGDHCVECWEKKGESDPIAKAVALSQRSPAPKSPKLRDLPEVKDVDRVWAPAKALGKGLRSMLPAIEVMEVLPADSVESFDQLADEAIAWGKRWKDERKSASRLRLMGVKEIKR